ncbi:MAG: O-antigen ligase family protein [Saprospiraceae bacterium]|nr:O-antigen ligase family protein [Saprospiraceae bacterium]
MPWSENFRIWLLAGIAAMMSVYPLVASYLTGILLIYTFTTGNVKGKIHNIVQPLPLLFISLYVVYVLGLFHTSTENCSYALQKLETKLGLLLFPILIFAEKISYQGQRTIFKAFVLGCAFCAIYCLSCAAVHHFISGVSNFTYSFLSDYIKFHPAYFSLYLGFGIFILLDKAYEDLFPKIIQQSLILFFATVIVLLASRMEVLVFLFLFNLTALYYYGYQQKKILKALFAVGLITLFFVGGSLILPQARLNNVTNAITTQKEGVRQDSSLAQRIDKTRYYLWTVSAESIREAPIFGVGTGDITDVMKEKFLKRKDVNPIVIAKGYNSHQQFLQIWLTLGIFALLLFIAILFVPLYLAWKQSHYLYALFLLSFILSILVESMLENQRGVIFYAFFNSLLASQLAVKRWQV